MHPNLEPDPTHTEGLTHIFLAINHKLLREDMEHLLIGGNTHGRRSLYHPLDIALGDLLFFDRHHAARVEAANMTTGNTCPDRLHLAVGHEFGLLERPLNRVDRGIDVHHHALL